MEEIEKCKWQYTIRYKDVSQFKVGDIVFLRSSPHLKMCVLRISNDKIDVYWQSKNGNGFETFSPQVLLHYKYACFVNYQETYFFCLN